MKLLILHLSDIHIGDKANPILGRAQSIVDAVKNLEPGAVAAIIAVTGDIAFSGREQQYLAPKQAYCQRASAATEGHSLGA